MSDLYENAIDSLRIGIDFFQKEPGYSSRKHAILTLFHSIELLLKERLYRTNPILIYRNIDLKITKDSMTAGIKDCLTRLDNMGIGLPDDERQTIESIQKIRNRIEHHRYDHHEKEDEVAIAQALKFILYFIEFVLEEKLDDHIQPDVLREIRRRVIEYNELSAVAEFRLHKWAKSFWPDYDHENEELPEAFEGTHDCPECGQSFLVIGYHEKPFCFHCDTSVDAANCEHCGRTYLVSEGCCSGEEDT